jgi:hypothetical protein
MSLDDLLNKQITIKEGLEMGIITARVLSDCDLFMRVQVIMEKENLLKTHAIEKVAEMCRVNEKTVWRSYSFTDKLMSVK